LAGIPSCLVEAIRDRSHLVLANLHGADIPPSAQRDDTSQSPQSRHSVSPTDPAFAFQKLPHLACPLGLPRLLMQHPHPFHERLVDLRPGTHRTVLPRIKPAPTDLEHLRHPSHAKLSLMGLHEPVPHDDSLAKYRAAF